MIRGVPPLTPNLTLSTARAVSATAATTCNPSGLAVPIPTLPLALISTLLVGAPGRTRKLGDEATESAAKGRVWTGEDAKARGLVDELGGFATALHLAKQAAQIPDDQDVTLKLYPKAQTIGEAFGKLTGRQPSDDDTAAAGATASRFMQLKALLRQMELTSQPAGSALMPAVPAP